LGLGRAARERHTRGAAETRVAIVAAGGIEAVVGAMKAHEGSAEVQARCCRVLWTIGVPQAVGGDGGLTEGCDWGGWDSRA